jgi:tetratricopeptide (TPR) repeat protein
VIVSIIHVMSDKASIIKEAQKYLAHGQVDKAISEWEKLIKESPDGNTYNIVGDLYLRKGDKAEAIDSFHKAADFFRREGFSLKALALYKKILNLNPGDAISLLALGELNESKGLTTDAIRFYLAAADTLSKEGNKEKLLEIYEKILALSPANIPLRSKVAEIYLKEGLISEAVKQCLHIARLYGEKGEAERAIEFYRKTLGTQPLNREAILELNSLYERTGNLDQAIEQMKEAASLFPQDSDILLRFAELCIAGGMFEEAREYLGQIVEQEPGNIRARRLLGDIYAKEGDREKAWSEYLSVLDEILLDENYEDAIKLLESFRDIDQVETGKRLVSLYIQLGDSPHVVRELTALGDVFIGQGKKKEALNCYREALKTAPDDDSVKERVLELEKEVGKEHIAVGEKKTSEEAIIEADIYIRYGLHESARDALEAFAETEPENIDLRLRLKDVYSELEDKEKAIGECLALSELYKKKWDVENSKRMVKEAYEINSEDPRLIGLKMPLPAEEEVVATAPAGPSIEDYSEEIAEADFYSRQGLIDEAREILERLLSLFPENEEINRKLSSLGHVAEAEGVLRAEEEEKEPEVPVGEILEVEEIPEPALDSDVMDIFNEFKKGLEKELEEEDYETHYNLGIAYKEMGLIDDAIKEFQTSRSDPKRFVDSSSMLGICYIEKGVYPLAIDALRNAIEKMEDKNESYWVMKYDLAEAYEKNGNLKEALDLYTEVYGWNSKFRAVSDKIDELKVSAAKGFEQKKPKEKKDRVSYL